MHLIHSEMDYDSPPFSMSGIFETLFPEVDVVSRKMDEYASIEVYRSARVDGVRAVIAYNDSSHASTQRFSLAHELCHWLLDFRRGQTLDVGGCGVEGGRREERRADYFAAELLVPLWSLDNYVDFNLSPDEDDEDALARRDQRIQRLASRFNVSMKCMRNRVSSLSAWRKILR